MLEKGHTAPEFNAPNQDDEPVKLSGYRDRKHVVLYFYPKDDTPGCTIEARQFTDLGEEFSAADTVIIGVSRDSCESHQAFIDKYAKVGAEIQGVLDSLKDIPVDIEPQFEIEERLGG